MAHRSHEFEAKRAEGGETYGIEGLRFAEKGQWLCRNPENDHRWVMSDEGFDEFYCEVGKSKKVKKIKKQEDGHKKGQSKHKSSSAEIEANDFGELFKECNEQQVKKEDGNSGNMV